MNETELDLTAIEARLAAITQGKWEYFKEYDTVETSLIETENQEYYQFIARVTSNGQEYSLEHNVDADGEFIAHAPTDIANLVAEVKRLRAHVSDLQKIALAKMAQDSQDLGLYDYYPGVGKE